MTRKERIKHDDMLLGILAVIVLVTGCILIGPYKRPESRPVHIVNDSHQLKMWADGVVRHHDARQRDIAARQNDTTLAIMSRYGLPPLFTIERHNKYMERLHVAEMEKRARP